MSKETLLKPSILPFSKSEKPPKVFSKFGKIILLVSLVLMLGVGFLVFSLIEKPPTQEAYLLELIARIENGEELPAGEKRNYCHLMSILRDSISANCVCVLDGINWDNPPKNPDKLPEVWEEFKQPTTGGNRRFFRHKIYIKIVIGFDVNNSNGEVKPHWHRENPNAFKGQEYIDKDCQLTYKKAKKSHIYVRK